MHTFEMQIGLEKAGANVFLSIATKYTIIQWAPTGNGLPNCKIYMCSKQIVITSLENAF